MENMMHFVRLGEISGLDNLHIKRYSEVEFGNL